ncbi:MAG: type II toxin-antitoxin system HicB family antitoxin [Desulfobacteraceae bacterium]|nr:type II toxin-antitoxin system HicB family antitoxin [Desulfobacteraceae bacterium]
MATQLTLEYWKDDGWYVGRLKEVPGVFSQGETLDELEENVKDAYEMMMQDMPKIPQSDVQSKQIEVTV